MAGDAEAGSGDASGAAMEPLACVSCRSRKLKCDRTAPACTRCTKVGGECVYPESRRKPMLKRRNVKELEERLAQVEGYLKDISSSKGKPVDVLDDASPDSEQTQDVPMTSYRFAGDASSSSTMPSSNSLPLPFDAGASFARGQELMHLGMTEALPPFDVMEELNNAFFSSQYHHIPLIHAGRYYESFYSSAPRKPPMCLQYAIWALGSFGHARFDGHSDIFYRRARQYLEMDEMRDDGEHFITLGHAQAWALTATYEARKLLFTRASVSCGRGVRLAQMMGLDRLDSGKDDLPPALGPTKSWGELEERRRVFWSIFAIDCHASVSTGWPNLVRSDDIMTRLPASEEAFASGIEETAPFLDEAIKGAPYASFAGTVITCECFKGILRHVFRPKPSDHPEDYVGGEFWRRHRELDNNLSSIFMFLPPSFRLLDNQRDPSAIYANLNLHAAVICLHHAAVEQADKHEMSDEVKSASRVRLKSAADEIVNIVKLTSHNTAIYKSPLCSLALYCASTVYVYLAKLLPSRTLPPPDVANLDIILRCMEAISRHHKITNGFLQQACLDIERNGLGSTTTVHLSALSKYRDFFGDFTANIPLLARSHVSGRTTIAPVLPGKLPLGNPKGVRFPDDFDYSDDATYLASRGGRGTEATVKRLIQSECYQPIIGPVSRNMGSSRPLPDGLLLSTTSAGAGAKRKRTAAWNAPDAPSSSSSGGTSQLFGMVDATTSQFMSQFDPTNHNNMFVFPDRSRTPSTMSSPAPLHTAVATTISSAGLGNTPEENRVDIKALQDKVLGPLWPLQEEESAMVAQIVEEIGASDPWTFLTGEDPMAWVDAAL